MVRVRTGDEHDVALPTDVAVCVEDGQVKVFVRMMPTGTPAGPLEQDGHRRICRRDRHNLANAGRIDEKKTNVHSHRQLPKCFRQLLATSGAVPFDGAGLEGDVAETRRLEVGNDVVGGLGARHAGGDAEAVDRVTLLAERDGKRILEAPLVRI